MTFMNGDFLDVACLKYSKPKKKWRIPEEFDVRTFEFMRVKSSRGPLEEGQIFRLGNHFFKVLWVLAFDSYIVRYYHVEREGRQWGRDE